MWKPGIQSATNGILALFLFASASLVFAQEEAAKPAAPAKPKAMTTDEAALAAWEFRPYQVQVWLCSDGSPAIEAWMENLKSEVVRQSELLDPCGWILDVQEPTSHWRSNFLKSIQDVEQYTKELPELESLANSDKLMIVTLTGDSHGFGCQTRELDIRTQQWGPILDGNVARISDLDSAIMEGISRAFMPIARVDRVSDDDEVFMRVRAMQACLKVDRTEDGGWVVSNNEDSPVWINPKDRFLPVVRRTDRSGNLIRLEPIDFTFLTIETQEGPKVVCSIQSFHRAPLHGRTSKRAQKLALVIRPPDRSTRLQLVTRGDDQTPLEDYEIFSRYANQPTKGEGSASEFLGKTDWKGEIDVPPSDRGLRILYIKHGNRPLKKLPMMPGLHARQVSTVPDDETRLYAEGVISGMNSEILNLVAQRQVYEAEIGLAIKRGDIAEARELLSQYQKLPSPQDLQNSLSDEELRLKTQTGERRELDFITTMFNTLREILNSRAVESNEAELRQKLQESSSGNTTASN